MQVYSGSTEQACVVLESASVRCMSIVSTCTVDIYVVSTK